VLAKVLAAVVVVAVVPGALLAFGELPAKARRDLVTSETRPVDAEEVWQDRIGSICGWQRKQEKLFRKAFRYAATPIDVEFALKSAMRILDENRAIFSRLEPPFEFQREARSFVQSLRSERASLAALLKAFRERKRAAFERSLRRFLRADARSSNLLNELGGAGCRAKPVTVPNEQRVRTV
jgi:hypothetical protein